jgi:hypothetical protein
MTIEQGLFLLEFIHFLRLQTATGFCILLPMAKKNSAAVSLGRRGGKATAERGPEYFRKIQALRKNRKGGRPPKESRPNV